MIMRRILDCVLVCIIFLIAGCGRQSSCEGILAKYTAVPVKIDGKLDDAAWQGAKVYAMSLSKDKLAEGLKLRDGGQVRAAWDDDYFYLGIRFEDSDITATGEKDQMHHYQFGDLCELFLKPDRKDNYVELYVTPTDKKTSFYIPNQKDGWPSRLDDYECGLEVAAYVGGGTLNKRDDRDRWWSAEIAMPVKDLERLGESISPGCKWRILVARYNYSKFFGEGDDQIEYSMMPAVSEINYHLIAEYGYLCLEK